MSKKFFILIGITAALGILWGLLQSGVIGAGALWRASEGGQWLLPLVSVSALLDSVNPCAFSILILTIAFLFSLGRTRRDILAVGGFYILGIFLVYIFIGLGILQALHLFNTPHFMAKVGSFLLILFGAINLIGHFFPSFPIKLKIPDVAHGKIAMLMDRATLPTAFLLGALVGLCEFPCTGGPYLLVLGLLHDHATFGIGLGYLLFYNAIFVLPLLVILLVASERSLLEKVEAWKQKGNSAMKVWGAVAMIALGVSILMF